MDEFRQDRVSGEWVLIAPSRKQRPREVAAFQDRGANMGTRLECPFCPGNEEELSRLVAEYGGLEQSDWQVRVVLNKYAALKPEFRLASTPSGNSLPPFGYQEVVIETPKHDASLETLDDKEIHQVVTAYRDRFRAISAMPDIHYISLFRNFGPGSGSSLSHPHAQLYATSLIPPRLEALGQRAKSYYEREGRCIICAEMEIERKEAKRIVFENDAFLTLTPFAPQLPFELWIMPKRHQARFDEITEDELPLFGIALKDALGRLSALHGRPSYNFAIESAPTGGKGSPHLHWRLHIVPRLADWAGYELGTGIYIVLSDPEAEAQSLREVKQAGGPYQ